MDTQAPDYGRRPLEEAALRAQSGAAQADLYRALSQRAIQRAAHTQRPHQSLVTIDTLIETHLARYTSPKTRKTKEPHLRLFAQKLASARLPLAEVTSTFIETHLRDEAKTKSWSATTLYKAQSTLRTFMRYAYEQSATNQLIVPKLKINGVTGRSLQYFYSVQECRRILAAAHKDDICVERAIHLALFNGLRAGDIMGAHMDHIRVDGPRVLLYLPQRKGGTSSTVHLPSTTVDLLPEAGRVITYSYPKLVQGLHRVEQQAGLYHAPLRLHPLRSTFVTLALDAKATTRDVMLAAGHKHLDTTYYYDQGYTTARLDISQKIIDHIYTSK